MASSSATVSRRQSDGGTIGRIHHFKLVLLGEASVGKSSLVLRFVKDQFRDTLESTVGGKLNMVLMPCLLYYVNMPGSSLYHVRHLH